jgi:hypothetical protein
VLEIDVSRQQAVDRALDHVAQSQFGPDLLRVLSLHAAALGEALLRGGGEPNIAESFIRLVTLICNSMSSAPSVVQSCNDVETSGMAELEPLWSKMDASLQQHADPGSASSSAVKVESALDQDPTTSTEAWCALIDGFWRYTTGVRQVTFLPSDCCRFELFILRHKPAVRRLIEETPSVILRHFHFVLSFKQLAPHFADLLLRQPLERRVELFYEYLDEFCKLDTQLDADDVLTVRREHILQDSCKALDEYGRAEPYKSGLAVQFEGEAGMGNGVRREWFQVLLKEMLNPDYGLFVQSGQSDSVQPNPNSGVNPDHLCYFRLAGRVVGLALLHAEPLGVRFTRSFYKHMLGLSVSVDDLQGIDAEFHGHLQWALQHDISQLNLELTFAAEAEFCGRREIFDLCQDGSKLQVTEENKHRFAHQLAQLRTTEAIRPQLTSFLDGFHQYIPR